MKRKAFFLAIMLALTGWALAHGHGNQSGHAHQYTFVGTLQALSAYNLTVTGPDADGHPRTITFKIDEDSQVPPSLKLQDTVVVGYDYSTDSQVFLAADVSKLPAWKKAPKSTFPDTAPCATQATPPPSR